MTSDARDGVCALTPCRPPSPSPGQTLKKPRVWRAYHEHQSCPVAFECCLASISALKRAISCEHGPGLSAAPIDHCVGCRCVVAAVLWGPDDPAAAQLGEVSPEKLEAVLAAMERASEADRAGDHIACDEALADARRAFTQ
jgi:hypothetical protein